METTIDHLARYSSIRDMVKRGETSYMRNVVCEDTKILMSRINSKEKYVRYLEVLAHVRYGYCP